jgi:FkbM family methyltransferase
VTQTTTIDIKDQTIQIPILKTFDSDLACDLTETWMIAVLEHLLDQNPGTFLDVGVNLGQTLIKVKGLEPGRKYIGFEPNSTCVVYAKALIKANQFKDCTIVPAGLFTEDALLSLECMDDGDADSSASLIKGFRPDENIQHRILVPVFQFKTIAPSLNLESVGLIKIDVEGAELEVIQSLYPVFLDWRPITLLEVLPVYSEANKMRQQRQEQLEELFSDLNYSFFRVEKTHDHEFSGLRKIETIGIHSDLSQCDYVVVPNELVATLSDVLD